MNPWLVFILAVIFGQYFLETVSSLLNLKALTREVPDEFIAIYDRDRYRHSQDYTRSIIRFGLLQETIQTIVLVTFLLVGGFNSVDHFARSFMLGSIATGIVFTGTLLLLSFLLGLPFSIYATFGIEERFGFNRTTPATFLTDIFKTILIVVCLGVPLLTFILWFFANSGNFAWLYCWLAVVLFGLIMHFFAPAIIMPLFNKFSPLPDGSLKSAITELAGRLKFDINGIFTMDGSRRSTKLNAFFTGFGTFRKIVFFDTLLNTLTNREIVAVLAHEIGHFKMNHIWRMLIISAVQTGLLFFLLGLFLKQPGLDRAFAMDHHSLYAGLIFFALLYSPLNTILQIGVMKLSRNHEFAADRFAVTATGDGEAMITALKKLVRENLSNLTPHPFTVIISHSHPPVLDRIKSLKALQIK